MGRDDNVQDQKTVSTYALTSAIVDTLTVTAWKNELWNTDLVEFDALQFTTGRETAEVLMSGQVDFATMADLPFLFASKSNPELRVVATLTTANTVSIVGNKSKGIQSVDSLRGKKIAMTPGTSGQFYLDAFMSENGIAANEYEAINLSPPAMLVALERGDIDAVTTWEPHVQTALNILGTEAIEIPTARKFKPIKIVIATRQDVIDEKPEAVRALLKGLIKAESVVAEDPETAKTLMKSHSQIASSSLNNI